MTPSLTENTEELLARSRREWNLCQSHSDYYGPTPTEWAFSYADPLLDLLTNQQREIEGLKGDVEAARSFARSFEEMLLASRAKAEELEKERDDVCKAVSDVNREAVAHMDRATKAEAEVSALKGRVAKGEQLYLAYWRRNGWDRPAPWTEQADAIRTMWDNIAQDARTQIEGEGR